VLYLTNTPKKENKDDKKEIREHFDKFFKDPEFGKLITKATD